MQGIVDFFVDIWNIPAAKGVVVFFVFVTLILTLVYVIKRFRGDAFGHERMEVLDHLSDFRQMLDEGKIDEKDFSKLKQQLSEQSLGESQPASKPKMSLAEAQARREAEELAKREAEAHSEGMDQGN